MLPTVSLGRATGRGLSGGRGASRGRGSTRGGYGRGSSMVAVTGSRSRDRGAQIRHVMRCRRLGASQWGGCVDRGGHGASAGTKLLRAGSHTETRGAETLWQDPQEGRQTKGINTPGGEERVIRSAAYAMYSLVVSAKRCGEEGPGFESQYGPPSTPACREPMSDSDSDFG